MYQIGGVVALPFVGPALDTWGRRIGMLIGALCIILGTIIQGTSHGVGQFMGGRFLLGFGVSIAASTGPMYAMIFLFGAIFSIGIMPLQALYPIEVLSLEMRAKGMAFSNLALIAAMLLNQFAWPISIRNIGWRTYIIFAVWNAIQAAAVWWFISETKGHTVRLTFSEYVTTWLLTHIFPTARETRRYFQR